MGKISKSYKIGENTYPNKTQAQAFISKFLQSQNVGRLSDENQNMVIDFFKLHWDYEKKRLNMDYISIAHSMGHNFFLIIYKDGDTDDFSYKKCFMTDEQRYKYDVDSAFRDEINSQIEAFRATAGDVCDISGETLERKNKHIDHHFDIIPFIKLKNDFIEINSIDANKIKLKKKSPWVYFEDTTLSKLWQDYHSKHAILRVVHKKYNTHKKL